MRKLIIVILLVLSGSYAMAQHTADIGVQLGAATYWGDIQGVNYSKSITPVAGVLGRWNFNRRLAVRLQLFTGNLKAEGSFSNALIGQSGTRPPNDLFPTDPLNPDYSYNFNRWFQSVEGLFEFNFRNYKLGNMKRDLFTPFVSIGVGGFYSRESRVGSFILDPNIAIPATVGPPATPEYRLPFYDPSLRRTNGIPVLTFTIPVGVGLKFNFTKRLGGVIEVIVRKTFSDNIDNLNDPKRFETPVLIDPPAIPPLTYLDANTGLNKNDWYATLTASLVFQLWTSRGNCTIYDRLKK